MVPSWERYSAKHDMGVLMHALTQVLCTHKPAVLRAVRTAAAAGGIVLQMVSVVVA
jgi:hypothetical protein